MGDLIDYFNSNQLPYGYPGAAQSSNNYQSSTAMSYGQIGPGSGLQTVYPNSQYPSTYG